MLLVVVNSNEDDSINIMKVMLMIMDHYVFQIYKYC